MQSVILPRKSHTNVATEANVANQCRDLKLLSHSAVCMCRLDDLAVDSDEEVDYSKMDQVTTDHSNCYASLKTQTFWCRCSAFLVAAGGAVVHSSCCLFQGNKKGPLGRWDFDTQEEYSDYMNNKEALPKYVLILSVRSALFSIIRSTENVKPRPRRYKPV